MTTGQSIAAAAEKLVGSPFRHQGRSAARGLDCSGVLVVAHEMAALDVRDYRHYACPPKPRDLVEGLQRNCLEFREAKPGMVLLFRNPKGRGAQHTGIDVGGGWMVHSEVGKGVVRERWRGTDWERELLGVFGHRGVRW